MNTNPPLDTDEHELLDSYERDEWHSVLDTTQAIANYQNYARVFLEQTAPTSELPQQKTAHDHS